MNLSVLYRLHLGALLAAALLSAPAPADEAAGKIAAQIQPFVERHELAGAVMLVANKERVLDLEAVGFADVEGHMMMPTNALFWIASQSKPITAAALMILVDEGKIGLDDPVEKYISEFKDVMVEKKGKGPQRPQRAITVRDVLSHMSGLPFRSAAEQPTLDLLPLREGALSYAKTPLHAEPGTKYQYSNAGINTAGRLIEIVSGIPYEDFLQQRLFTPLGMKDTTFVPSEEQLKRLAKSYKVGPNKMGLVEVPIGQLKYPLSDRQRQPMPAGGLFSTAQDVGRFCQMALNGGTLEGKRVLSESAVKQMTSRQTPETVKESYGLGWSVSPGGFGHGGAHATNMSVDTKRGLVLVWLVQQAGPFPGDGGKAQGVFRKVAEERFGAAK
jgi:CubicO group peptidase (beta-lactamase class C family)